MIEVKLKLHVYGRKPETPPYWSVDITVQGCDSMYELGNLTDLIANLREKKVINQSSPDAPEW